MIVTLDRCLPGGSDIHRVVDLIVGGGVIAYPAETMYGLGGDGFDRAVDSRIRSIKGREETKPFLLLVDEIDRLESILQPLSPVAERLAREHWPGPLTLLLKVRENISAAPGGTIAVRVPAVPYLREWVRLADTPLSSTSANRSGSPPAGDGDEVVQLFAERVDLIVAGPRFPSGGVPSTIVDTSGDVPRVVRQGALEIRLD